MSAEYIYVITGISIFLLVVSTYMFVYSPLFSLKVHTKRKMDKLFLKENNLSTGDVKDLFLYTLKLLDFEKIEDGGHYAENGILLSKLKFSSGHTFSIKTVIQLSNLNYVYPPFEIEFYDEFSKCTYNIAYKDFNVKASAIVQNGDYTRTYTIEDSLSNRVYSNILLMNLLSHIVRNVDLSIDSVSTIVRNLNKNVRVNQKTIDKYI